MADQKAVTATQWKKNKRHYITLPSNSVVGIELPDLPNMLRLGQIPTKLTESVVAILSQKKRDITEDDVKEQADFFNKLCALTVKEPEVDDEFFASSACPYEDKEMIIEFAMRNRDMDAVGHHLAGLETSEDFRKFRGIVDIDSAMEGV